MIAYCFANCNMPISTTFNYNGSKDYSVLQSVVSIITVPPVPADGYLCMFAPQQRLCYSTQIDHAQASPCISELAGAH